MLAVFSLLHRGPTDIQKAVDNLMFTTWCTWGQHNTEYLKICEGGESYVGYLLFMINWIFLFIRKTQSKKKKNCFSCGKEKEDIEILRNPLVPKKHFSFSVVHNLPEPPFWFQHCYSPFPHRGETLCWLRLHVLHCQVRGTEHHGYTWKALSKRLSQ